MEEYCGTDKEGIYTKYTPYLFFWEYARKRIYKSCSLQIEMFFTRDNCTSINEPHDAKQISSILNFQSETQFINFLSVDHTDVLGHLSNSQI